MRLDQELSQIRMESDRYKRQVAGLDEELRLVASSRDTWQVRVGVEGMSCGSHEKPAGESSS